MSTRRQDVVLTEQEQRTLRLMEGDLRRTDPGFLAAFEGGRARHMVLAGAALTVLGLALAVGLCTASVAAAFAGYLVAVAGTAVLLQGLVRVRATGWTEVR